MIGILVIDKPVGKSSARAVDVVRARLGQRRVGHCGTLDPLASGVLVMCIGRAGRLQDLLMKRSKAYRAHVVLGAVSETDDAEGPIQANPDATPPTSEDLVKALEPFVGEFEQRPPAFSAVHVDGKRAYKAARKGETLEIPTRTVTVHGLDLLRYEFPDVELDVDCGKGVYIRSIARDLGAALGCGAYLGGLRRTRACGLGLEHAVDLESVTPADVLPLGAVLGDQPRVDVPREHEDALLGGRPVPCAHVPPLGPGGELFAWVNDVVKAWVRPVPGGVQSRAMLA